MIYYKVLGPNGESINGGTGRWPLPKDGQPGEWVEVAGPPLIPCKHGLHVCTIDQLPIWLGPTIWRVEIDGELLRQDNKCVVRRARLLSRCDAWTEQTARLFAVACASRALDRERAAGREPDPQSWAALEVATRYANKTATKEELASARAAGAAAVVAAWAAAVAAAGDADIAWTAAVAAAVAAAKAAAGATGDAARDAAWAAAVAAAKAAGATGDAARDAERAWQVHELKMLLED
jgi:hypothetical protein